MGPTLLKTPRRLGITMNLVHKIVRRLLRDDDVNFSRNKNYEAYEDAKVKRALRIFRHLRSVEDDILAANEGSVELRAVEQEDGRVVVRLHYPAANGERTSFMTVSEWKLLLESDRITDTLRVLLDDAPTATQDTISNLTPILES